MNKKATAWYFRNWAELFFFILLVIGFLLSIATPSAVISYFMIFSCGMMAGRLWFERKNKLIFPYFLIIVGFLIGYILGSFYGSRKVILTLFVLGTLISYYLHDRGFLHDLKI